MTQTQREKELVAIAQQIVARIREDPPDEVHQWVHTTAKNLAKQTGNSVITEWIAIAITIATAVPVDKTWRELTAWINITPPTAERTKNGRTNQGTFFRHPHNNRPGPRGGLPRHIQNNQKTATDTPFRYGPKKQEDMK